MRIIISLLGLLASLSVQAAPITWTLNNVGFITEDGAPLDTGLVTGQFDYDADTGVYSNIDLVTTTYEADYGWAGGRHQHIANDSKTSATGAFFGREVGPSPYGGVIGKDALVLLLSFETALTNAGGIINVVGGDAPSTPGHVAFGLTLSNGDVVSSGPRRKISGGTISAAGVVPIPGAVWLFGSGLAGLGWLRRKRTS